MDLFCAATVTPGSRATRRQSVSDVLWTSERAVVMSGVEAVVDKPSGPAIAVVHVDSSTVTFVIGARAASPVADADIEYLKSEVPLFCTGSVACAVSPGIMPDLLSEVNA
ncbi:hypothetical protein H849_05190 [Prescottella equi NBRC 101255 = C 7]|nr:hypothetical protein H849_05190 [Prescottella equi NBRC 101255 = C 7]